MRYDLIVLGNTPAGRQAAWVAARQDLSVLVIESPADLRSDFSLSSGTVWNLVRELWPDLAAGRPNVPDRWDRIRSRMCALLQEERRRTLRQCEEVEVEFRRGAASFVDEQTIAMGADHIEAERFLIAAGSAPTRERAMTPDRLWLLDDLPRTAYIVGASTTGLRTAWLVALAGVEVTVADALTPSLAAAARGVEELLEDCQAAGVQLEWNCEVLRESQEEGQTQLQLSDQTTRDVELVLWADGRRGCTMGLNLPAAGVVPDDAGRLWCAADHQTWSPKVFAAGDVVGFPESTAQRADAGALAVQSMLAARRTEFIPFAAGATA